MPFQPGVPRIATAVIELAVKPRETNEFGQRAKSVDEKEVLSPLQSLNLLL